jgi:hypothetical protein
MDMDGNRCRHQAYAVMVCRRSRQRLRRSCVSANQSHQTYLREHRPLAPLSKLTHNPTDQHIGIQPAIVFRRVGQKSGGRSRAVAPEQITWVGGSWPAFTARSAAAARQADAAAQGAAPRRRLGEAANLHAKPKNQLRPPIPAAPGRPASRHPPRSPLLCV